MQAKKTIRFGCYLLLLCCYLPAVAQNRIELLEGLSILLPSEFMPLSATEIKDRYDQNTPPLAVYVHPQDQRTQWVFTLSATRWRAEDTKIMQDFLYANIENLYEGKVSWLKKQIQNLRGRKAVHISFIGRRSAEKNAIYPRSTESDFHTLLAVVLGDKQLLVHFSCPARYYQQWEEDVEGAISTIRIP